VRRRRLPLPGGLTDAERAVVHQVASLCLDYPDDELVARLPVLESAVAPLPAPVREPLARLVAHLGSAPVRELAEDYVATFDLKRRASLFLSYYAYGDTRKRGVALLRFKEAYRRAGLVLGEQELPDHLCVVLEFAATGDADAGVRLLQEHRAGLELLRLALQDTGSPYADALTAVSATLPTLAGTQREAVARLAAEGPPGEEVGLEPFAPPEYLGARA
jgi:nitrate reductase molybdenum cofactor assembly chaperone NarJ/NarW